MALIINPGSGAVERANTTDAVANMVAFIADLRERGRDVTWMYGVKTPLGTGRWRFAIDVDGRRREIDMPGVAVELVRFTGAPGQNIFEFPRLYVDGSSWLWCFALDICGDHEEVS